MQLSKKNLSDTTVQLTIAADANMLEKVKQELLRELAKSMKIAGFREGKAPLTMVEKQADPTRLQSEFLERAMNRAYSEALRQEKLRPAAQPKVKVTKFVPFDALEFEAEVEIIGEVKLPDYQKFKISKKEVKITQKDVDEVLKALQVRGAEKKEVTREAKDGDEVWIDFTGVDAKTKERIKGADGKDYPLLLGSNTFIPGFETNLVGLKAGDEKTFTLEFPKDYGVAALQSRKVSFTAQVTKVNEVVEPKLDDEFAAKVGPFKSLADLKEDIKKQLGVERDQQTTREFENELIQKVTEGAKVAIPASLIDEEIDREIMQQKQNLLYRGQTWQEFLKSEGKTEDEYKKSLRPNAELRVKAGLVLAEVAEKEKIELTAEEVSMRIELLKGQYKDAAMQAELNKPENRRDIAARMVSEKTIQKLIDYVTGK